MKRKIHWSGTQRLKKQERVISGLGQDSTGDYLSNLRLNAIAILRESDQRNSTNAMDDSIKPLFPSTGKANFFFFLKLLGVRSQVVEMAPTQKKNTFLPH